MIDRRRFLAAASAIAATGVPGIGRAAPGRLTVTTGHPPVFMWVKAIQEVWLPAINAGLEAAGEAPIQFNEAYATIAAPGTELQTIEDGISDMGYVSTLFHPGELPLQNVSYMVPFGSGDVATVIAVADRLNAAIPAMRDAYTDYNQIALTGAAVDAYHLMTTFPVNDLSDLKGRKIAAPGPAGNWLLGTGAVPVASNLNEYYNNISLGVYEGAVTFLTAAAAAKLHEVAPHVTLCNFGAMYVGGLTVNRGVWDGLDEAERTIFTSAADTWRDAYIEGQTTRATGALKMLRANAEVREMPKEQRIAWAQGMPNIPGDWAEAMEARGLPGREVARSYVEGLLDAGAELPRRWEM